MDMDEEGSGLLGIDLPKVKNHVLMRSVWDLFVGGFDLLRKKRRAKKERKKSSKSFTVHRFLICPKNTLGKLFLAFDPGFLVQWLWMRDSSKTTESLIFTF